MNTDVEVKSYPTVHAFIQGIQNEEVDIALINTFGYLLLETSQKSYSMQPLLALDVKEGVKDNYTTAFVSSFNSPFNSLKDVKQRASATDLYLVSIGSTSGNLVPRLALSSAGITDAESSFKTVTYAKTHAATIDSIISGEARLGAMGSAEYYSFTRLKENEGKLKLVWLSPEIPLGPVLVSNKFSAANKELILQAFLTLHKNNAAALESVKSGWSEAKHATKYIRISKSYYNTFKKQLGRKEDLHKILYQFAN